MPPKTGARVALVSPPVCATDTPSLGLSLLKAALATRQIQSTIYYLNVWFAERIGLAIHRDLLSWPQLDLANEWIFSRGFWGSRAAPDDDYVTKIIEGGAPEHRDARYKTDPQGFTQKLFYCRRQAEAFFDHALTAIPWKTFRLVGFQSQFQQELASLTLARRLKERYPDLFIVFGGVNARAGMGRVLLSNFPFIDAVCTGEGDIVFPQLVEALVAGSAPPAVPGILYQGRPSPADHYPIVMDMDRLPYPDFDDFFSQRTCHSSLPAEDCYLVLETSRGCWWGQRSQCTFCGLHRDEIISRQKSAARVLREMNWLLDRYGTAIRTILFTDLNVSHELARSLLPRLIASHATHRKNLFFETRIYTEKARVRLMRKAGVRSMQPGIESFSTSLLRRMRKGTTALQNVQFLKWCAQFGIRPGWNYIFGFPGERADDYARMPDIIRAIEHLPPPVTIGRIRFDRFGPYFSQPSAFGISSLRPFPAYRYVYAGLDTQAVEGLAYFFTGEFHGHERIDSYAPGLLAAVDEWLQQAPTAALFTVDENGRSIVCDFRPGARDMITPLTRVQARLYRACDCIASIPALLRVLSAALGRQATEKDLHAALAPLIDRRLLLEEEHHYLALAVSLDDEYFPPESVWPRMPAILAALQRGRRRRRRVAKTS